MYKENQIPEDNAANLFEEIAKFADMVLIKVMQQHMQ